MFKVNYFLLNIKSYSFKFITLNIFSVFKLFILLYFFLDLYCPNEIDDIDGVDDGDLYLTGNKDCVGPTPESVAFLDEQKHYHENKACKNFLIILKIIFNSF